MLPFPQLVAYGNIAPVPTVKINTMQTYTTGNASAIHYSNGELWAIGTSSASSNSSRFGDGYPAAQTYTVWNKINTNVRLYTCSSVSTIVIKNDGTAWASGNLATSFPTSAGYTYTNTGTWTDVSAVYTSVGLNINNIRKIVQYESSPVRQYLIDNNNQLWGLGNNQYGALGTNTTTGYTTLVQITNGDNCKDVMPTQYGVVVSKNDGSIWVTGTNTLSQLVMPTTTTVYTVLTPLTDFTSGSSGSTGNNYNIADIKQISVTDYTTHFLMNDGSMRIYGSSGNASIFGKSGSDSTVHTSAPYRPVTPTSSTVVTLMQESRSISSNILLKTASSILVAGANTSTVLGTGGITNSTATIYYPYTPVNTGVLSYVNLSEIKSMMTSSFGGYLITDTEIYTSGTPAGTGIPNYAAVTWTLMPHPYTRYTAPSLAGTVAANISTTIGSSLLTRQYHQSAQYTENKFIISGGTSSSSTSTVYSDFNIFDGTTSTWSTLSTSLPASYGAACAVIGDTYYQVGGYNAAGNSVATMYSVNLLTGATTTITGNTNQPAANGWGRMVALNGLLYLWGHGVTSSSTWSSLLSYNPSTKVWTTLAASPNQNGYAQIGGAGDICTDGTYLYANSGSTSASTQYMYRYNIQLNTWSLAQIRPVLTTSKTTYYNGYIYSKTNNAGTIFAYDITSNIWYNAIPSGLSSSAYSTLHHANSKVYMFGGNGSVASSNFYRID